MSKIIPFQFESHNIQVIVDDDGKFQFIAKEVSDILNYSDASKMCDRLDDDEKSNRQIRGLGSPTGGRGVIVINESGLYSAILGSNKPEAKRFKKWVTSEVLPSIRKTGTYVAHNAGLSVAEAMELFQKMVPSIIASTVTAVMEGVAADQRKFEKRFEDRLAAGQIGTAAGVTTGVLLDDFGIKGVSGLSVRMSNILCRRGCQLPGGERAHSGKRSAKLFQPDKARQMMHDWLADDCRRYVQERKGQSNLFPLKRAI